jgi:hypothetical protein
MINEDFYTSLNIPVVKCRENRVAVVGGGSFAPRCNVSKLVKSTVN